MDDKTYKEFFEEVRKVLLDTISSLKDISEKYGVPGKAVTTFYLKIFTDAYESTNNYESFN